MLEIDVYLTPEFHKSHSITPLLILFDGDESRNLLKVPVILNNLFGQGRIPPMAVFLRQPYEHRETDLGCNQATNLFLVNELVPWLREQYGIRTAAKRTIIAGSSLGLAAAYAAMEYPGVIGNVLSQSGSFLVGKSESKPEWLTAEFSSRPRLNVRFYLDAGLMETYGGERSQLTTNRRFRDSLRKKGYSVTYLEFSGTHAFPCWRAGFADALTNSPF